MKNLDQAYFETLNIDVNMTSDFWINCKDNFTRDEIIEFSYFTPKSFGRGTRAYVGLIPAEIPHNNQTLNAQHKYACREILGGPFQWMDECNYLEFRLRRRYAIRFLPEIRR